jgi:CubicO group peptidase (beta-lactamase class C family)
MKSFLYLILFSISASGNIPLAFDLERIKKDNNLPGLISAFYQNEELIESAAVGVRKVHERYELSTEDKFHLGSCTKAMTATLAAILVEKGFIAWDATLKELYPDINIHSDYADVTFDLLFAHRSGLAYFSKGGDFGDLWQLVRSELYPPKETREIIAVTQLTQSAKVKPCLNYLYSNTGYMVAASILEKVMNESFEDLLYKYLFKPLNMKSCGFGPTSNPSMRTALQPWGHYINDEGKIVSYHGDNPPAFNPAGGVHCGFSDWAKFLHIHMNALNGEYRLLSKATFKKLHSAYPAADSNYTFGGWGIVKREWANGITLTHGGSNTLNTARVWIAPQKESLLMSATNIKSYEAMEDAIVNLINRNLK